MVLRSPAVKKSIWYLTQVFPHSFAIGPFLQNMYKYTEKNNIPGKISLECSDLTHSDPTQVAVWFCCHHRNFVKGQYFPKSILINYIMCWTDNQNSVLSFNRESNPDERQQWLFTLQRATEWPPGACEGLTPHNPLCYLCFMLIFLAFVSALAISDKFLIFQDCLQWSSIPWDGFFY